MFGVLLASDLGGTVRIVQQAGDIVFKKGGREFRIAKTSSSRDALASIFRSRTTRS